MSISMNVSINDQIASHVIHAKNGDQEAFTQLIRKTQNLTTTIALSIVKDIDASEDVAQQVYIKLWEKLPSLQSENSFLPWLRQITRYTAFNYLRDNKTEQRLQSESAEILIDSLADEGDTSLDSLNNQQISHQVRIFIDALPDEDRELILLYYREEQSTKQVAQLLELSEANVRQKLSRARQRIKQDWLSRYGKVVLNSAPGLGFSALITGLLSNSSPVAAATVSASVASGHSSFAMKLLAWIGGSALGAGIAMLAVFFSTKMLIANIQDKSFAQDIKRYRNLIFVWIVFFTVLLMLSYEYTQGWVAPVASYVLFSLGLVRLIELTQFAAAKAGLKKTSKFCIDPLTAGWKMRVVNWAGPIMGGIGLISGLVQSGRFV